MEKRTNPLLWFVQNWEEILCSLAIAAMLVVCCAYVLARYIFRYSIIWGQEFCTICLIYVTFVGSAAAYKRNLHYGMDFLTDHLPRRMQYVLKLVINAVLIVLFVYMSYVSAKYTLASRKTMQVSRIPYSYLDFAAVLGFASMSVYSVIFFIQGIFKPEKYKSKFMKPEEGPGDLEDAT